MNFPSLEKWINCFVKTFSCQTTSRCIFLAMVSLGIWPACEGINRCDYFSIKSYIFFQCSNYKFPCILQKTRNMLCSCCYPFRPLFSPCRRIESMKQQMYIHTNINRQTCIRIKKIQKHIHAHRLTHASTHTHTHI